MRKGWSLPVECMVVQREMMLEIFPEHTEDMTATVSCASMVRSWEGWAVRASSTLRARAGQGAWAWAPSWGHKQLGPGGELRAAGAQCEVHVESSDGSIYLLPVGKMVGVGEGLRRVPKTARHTSSCISAAVCSWRTGPRRWLPRTVGVEHKLLTQDSRLLLFLCNVMKTLFCFFKMSFLISLGSVDHGVLVTLIVSASMKPLFRANLHFLCVLLKKGSENLKNCDAKSIFTETWFLSGVVARFPATTSMLFPSKCMQFYPHSEVPLSYRLVLEGEVRNIDDGSAKPIGESAQILGKDATWRSLLYFIVCAKTSSLLLKLKTQNQRKRLCVSHGHLMGRTCHTCQFHVISRVTQLCPRVPLCLFPSSLLAAFLGACSLHVCCREAWRGPQRARDSLHTFVHRPSWVHLQLYHGCFCVTTVASW